MDAQNANEAASTKPAASSASPSVSARPGPDSDRPKPSSSSNAALIKSPSLSRAVPPSSKDAKATSSKSSSTTSTAASSHSKESSRETSKGASGMTAASTLSRDSKSLAAPSRDKQDDDGGGTDGNSEAETIVLSKDGSPSKPRNRKVIKHEDKPNGEPTPSSVAARTEATPSGRKHASERKDGQSEKVDRASGDAGDAASSSSAALQQKKRRLQEKEKQQQGAHQQSHPRVKDTSSSLSSAPASPPRSRQPSSRPHSGSDSDRGQRSKSPKRSSSSTSRDRLRPPEKLVPHKRKAPKAESDDEAENHKVRRLRLASAGAGGDGTSNSSGKPAKDSPRHSSHNNNNGGASNGSAAKASASRTNREPSRNRSLSPQQRGHRRSASTQLPSQSNGLGLKKKRVPAPLQSTDYNSDESSASGSPHVRSAKLRSLTTPATTESAISPAKIGPHKKHLDAHGQTFLARACARGEYELAKHRLQERPDDLNVADFAGNTPLQIAAINGYGEIVKLLIDAGCNLDCVNYDKDTPLLDAVDNGHLEVVKLLLDAGVNPRKANVNGEEPLDRVSDDIENGAEIKAALIEARKKVGERRFTSEEHRHESDEMRALQGPESPRRSPAPTSASSRRAGTVRATKTSNHLLYMPMDDKTLRLAAGRGDEETVIRILQVREAFDDPESMVAAARGGHDVVMQLLLALGRANPDPPPISSVPPEHATPMLAAIGQENIKVVSLLLEQNNFNPTQRFRGDTYYEIARQRAGPNWKDEEDILKKAYDNYKKTHGGKTKSPSRKDAESRRAGRAVTETREDASLTRAHRRKLSSPSQERTKKTITGAKTSAASGTSTSPREEKLAQKRNSDHSGHADGKTSPKRAGSSSVSATKHKQRDDRSSVTSNLDRDTPPPVKQISKSKKADSESVAVSSEGETVKPRRKLISGRELKDEKVREKEREKEREKQRRTSLASSNTTAPSKEASSPNEPRQDDAASDKARAEKHRDRDRDRARQLKKEESRDSTSGPNSEGPGKRHRQSETPPNVGTPDRDSSEAPIKRRRLDADANANSSSGGKEKKMSKASASPDNVPSKSSAQRDSQAAPSKLAQRRREDEDRKSSAVKTKKREASSDRGRKDTLKPSVAPAEKSIHVKSEDVDVEMPDASPEVRSSAGPSGAAPAGAEAKVLKEKEDEKKRKAEAEAQAAEAKKEEELQRRRQEEEETQKKEEEKRKREEEEARLKEEEEKRKRELEEQRKKEEEEEKERKRLEEEEQKRKDEERRRKEEEERRKREEEEEKRRQEEQKRKAEEEERKRREEEERLRREQLEREAAEEARRRREEEERKERQRKEQERIRAEREAEELRRRQREEEERIRVAKLPPLLQWLSTCPNPKLASVAKTFRTMQGVRYDCINTSATGSPEGREQWLMNTQVALVLGEKDLSLSQYSSWRRHPVTMLAKRIIWRLESDRYSLTDPDLFEFGRQLPGYYGVDGPESMSYLVPEKLRREAWEKFSATDMFFVKVSDVMSVVPTVPHLRDIRLTVVYRELPEEESQLTTFVTKPKWKSDPDPDRFYGFAPRNKYYVNGQMVKEERPGLSAVSKTPFPEVRVPRRGFVSVSLDDPDFSRLCKEQGIDPSSFSANRSPKLPNGVTHSPKHATHRVNGRSSHVYGAAVHSNGNSSSAARAVSLPGGPLSRPLVNGVNGAKNA